MPLTIGAFDKLKAAALSLPMSGKTLVGAVTGSRLYTGVRQRYQTPAAAYGNLLQQKRDRDYTVTDYATFRIHADRFDPTDATADSQALKGQQISRDLNKLSLDDWNRLLKPGALLDCNVKDLFALFGTGMTVHFINHQSDATRLKRIEITYQGLDMPQIISMHW